MRRPCMLLVLPLALLCGCSEDSETGDDTTPSTGQVVPGDGDEALKKELRQISMAWALSNEQRSPFDSIEDLKREMGADGPIIDHVESGEIVVRWGLKHPEDFPNGYEGTVIAYEREVPTSGGWVAMADGTNVEMTVAEFQEKLGEQPQN